MLAMNDIDLGPLEDGPHANLIRYMARKGLDGTLAQHQHDTLGLPTRTPDETAMAIEAVRAEMSLVGHWLAERYQFEYPQTLEDVVRQIWSDNKEILVSR